MKILSKINSISSLNDKNLEKFTAGNNNRFLATKSYIDFLHSGPGGSTASASLSYDTQPQLGSAKNLKLNAEESVSAMFWSPSSHPQQKQISDRPMSSYWEDSVVKQSSILDSLSSNSNTAAASSLQQQKQHTDKPVTLFSWGDTAGIEPSTATLVQMDDAGNMTVSSTSSHHQKSQQPLGTMTNLRNTVSSSNLALNINYNDNQQQQPPPSSSQSLSSTSSATINPAIPMIIPQKFQFNQPQSQPMMKNSSSSGSHDVTVLSAADQSSPQQQQILSSRKGSLPHSSLLTSNNINNNNNNNSSSNFKEIISGDSNNIKIGAAAPSNGSSKLLSAVASASSSSTPAGGNTVTSAMLSSSAPVNASQHLVASSCGVGENGSNSGNTSNEIKSSQKWPVVASPHQVMMLYMNKLTPYEHHEIYKYPQIYFIGANAKKRPGVGSNNSDYDNENGSYM